MSDIRPPSTRKQRRRRSDERASSVTYMRVVEEVTKAGITQAELAKAVGAGPRTVQNWASGQNSPRGDTIKRLLDVRTIIELLSDSYTDEGIDIWLHARNRNLDMHRPIDLIINGQIDTVIAEAKWIAGGM
jgi:transcriptional regulator with XRE-family HTH domain